MSTRGKQGVCGEFGLRTRAGLDVAEGELPSAVSTLFGICLPDSTVSGVGPSACPAGRPTICVEALRRGSRSCLGSPGKQPGCSPNASAFCSARKPVRIAADRVVEIGRVSTDGNRGSLRLRAPLRGPLAERPDRPFSQFDPNKFT